MATKKIFYLLISCIFLLSIIVSYVSFIDGDSETYFNANCWAFSCENTFHSDFLVNINFERIREHIKYFGSLKSRVTGYPGYNSAANYIINFFKNITEEFPECGAKISIQEYDVLVPVDVNTSITIVYPENKTLEAYALWPNLIQTSPLPLGGIQGTLIYTGNGDLREFNNKTVKDSIVLMDFDSRDNWINAAKLGAKAVIFIETPNMNYYNSIKKFLLAPIYFPRLYVSSSDGDYLKNLIARSSSPPIIIIKSRMIYQSVAARNIIMEIPGEINDTIVIGAHYDSWSVVPALAPGADEAAGISTMLELARFFASHKPYRTVVFVALSGHWQALSGSRAFTEQYIFSEEVISGLRKINMFIGLDFSTDNDEMAFLIAGHAFKVLVDDSSLTKPLNNEFVLRYSNLGTLIGNIISKMEANFGVKYNVDVAFRSDGWWARIPGPYILDSEPISATGIIAFTIRTDNCYRINWGTPLSTFEKVSFENLKPQVEVSFRVIFELTNVKDAVLPSYVPQRITVTGSIRTGCVTVEGKSFTFNYSKGWYEPLPNAIIHMPLKATTYPFAHIITCSDANGSFVIYGVVTNLGRSPYFAQFISKEGYPVMAYLINNESGFIEYAPDAGIYGSRQIDFYAKASNHPYMATTVSFKCSTIELYDLYDVENIADILTTDPRFTDTNLALTPVEFQVFDFKSYSAFSSFSYIYYGFEHVGIVFIPQNQRFSLSIRLGVTRKLAILLLNTSKIPEGEGYYSFSGEKKLIFNAFNYTSDIFRLASSRYSMLYTFLVRNAMSEIFFNNAEARLNRATLLIQQKRYDLAYKEILSAFSWSIALYDSTFNLINGVAYNTIILFSVIVPFTLLFEELVFSTKGRGKIISITSIGFIAIFAFYMLHPGMKILSNALISLLGIVVCALLLV
ncbi:M28 family peptidase, partial [Candidatus Bathyarchaeota archaeon]|nr:M28 family peptidase [Candidatus Bathyarchaeota archaeon]